MPEVTLEQALQIAMEHHRRGETAEAETIYRQILKENPVYPDALNLLGVVEIQKNNLEAAIKNIELALQQAPESAIYMNNLGEAYRASGDLEKARMYYEKSVSLSPSYADALNNLGVVAYEQDQLDTAIEYYQKALLYGANPGYLHTNLGKAFRKQGQWEKAKHHLEQAGQLMPSSPDVLHNLGLTLQGIGDFMGAEQLYRRAIAINPTQSSVHNSLGTILQQQGKNESALTCFKKATELDASNAEAFNNWGNILNFLKQPSEAIDKYQSALAIQPDFQEVHFNLGNLFRDRDQLEQAISHFKQAISLKADFEEAHLNLGICFQGLGELSQAITHYRKAINCKPSFALAHRNLSLALLLMGNFEDGWREYEWRLKIEELPSREFDKPQWEGEDLQGKTLLVHDEQGVGDAVQMIRYISFLKTRGARIILECKESLFRLFQLVEGIDLVVAKGNPLPEFDVYISLMSLPYRMKTTLETIPAEVPYLNIPKPIPLKPISGLPEGTYQKIGLVWASRSTIGEKKSHELSEALESIRLPGVMFYSLQTPLAAEEKAILQQESNIAIMEDQLTDFWETASIIAQLDLLITVDTACAHLAGALGIPVWILLPFAPDWRWLTERDDNPWYPTARLFRQKTIGDWSEVWLRVTDALSQLTSP